MEHLKEAALKRYQEFKIEPPATKHLERLIRSTLHTYTKQTLRALVKEFKTIGDYDKQIQTTVPTATIIAPY